MIGWLRLAAAGLWFLLATIVMVPLQFVAIATKVWGEDAVRRRWHRVVLAALGLRVREVGAMSAQRPLLLVANHVSWTDITALAAHHDVTFVAKAELASWPVLGRLARFQRPVLVERDAKRKTGEQAGEVARRFAEGAAIVLFPEGTTSDGTILLQFKSSLFGAASLAIREGAVERVFVQPVAIAYTRLQGLPMGRRLRGRAAWIGDATLAQSLVPQLRQGGMDVELRFGEPAEFTAATDRKAMARTMEEEVRALLVASLRAPL